jgi:hypothetical protein
MGRQGREPNEFEPHEFEDFEPEKPMSSDDATGAPTQPWTCRGFVPPQVLV